MIGDERGSAVAEFVMVSMLVSLVFLGAVQLTLVLYVRNALMDAAAEGARYGAIDLTSEEAEWRTAQLIGDSLGSSYAQDVTARRTIVEGMEVVEVEVTAPLPLVGMFGANDGLTVREYAFVEGR